jgi:PAS domain S-box-containing protein
MSAIVESSEEAIISTTLDGLITTWNRGAERLYGYSHEEAVGRHISMLAPDSLRNEVSSMLDAIREGELIDESETMRVRKDGSAMDISVNLSPVFDSEGHIAAVSAIGRDVTQLRKAQRDLAEREGRIRLLLDSTAEGIIGLGPDGLCTFVNPACLRLLGYGQSEELIGRHIHNIVHSPNGHDHSERDCSISSVLLTGQGTHSDQERLRRADGNEFISECWSYPIRRGSQVVGVVVTFLDVTDRKAAEDEIRTGARRREEFLAMLSHELRNPLAAVVSAVKVMRMATAKQEQIDKARQIVERQSRHMARLLDDLLDVSRITRGGIALRKEDLDLREIVRGAIEALTPTLEERSAQLEVDLPDHELPVRGDAARMQQVVVNLISNAARYSPIGSTIALSGHIDGSAVVLRVLDHGRGISPTMLSDIFEMFVQDEQGLERSTGGLGIGLTLVRQIIELHGGRVQAHSDGVGKGSEFVVTLPLQPHAVIHRLHEPQQGPVPRRVLIVEDQDDAREMLRLLLESMGHIVVEEADGGAAVETLEREHPDVALIDIGLPIMSGYDVARLVRKNRNLDDVLLVALTGYGRDSDIEAARAAGFDAHVTKPADAQVIDQVLAEKIRRRAS